ncbi:MAG: hypothetical protein JWO19_972 [Bryobacterales bacterium]|nr:hypothetical protein [Bryobacterales bacterium]
MKRGRNTWAQGHVNASVIVMAYPPIENVLQMPLPQRDEEIQALPADGSDHTFASGICLGRPERRPQYAHAHGGHSFIQFLGEDAVPIVDQEAERMITGECFTQLLLGPFRAGVIGDVDVQDSAPAQFHENEYIKDTESGRHHDEEVTSHNSLGVIAHEGQPALAGIGLSAGTLGQILTHRAGRNRIPSFSFNSLAMCLSPQVGFSRAIWRINAWRSFGRRGRPVGQDFHRQKRRNPLRCHRISVSGLSTTKALRQSNHRLTKLISQRVESSAR